MLDKHRFSSAQFAHSHEAAEGTILQGKDQGLGSHKVPSAFGQMSTHRVTIFTKYWGFFSLATLPHTRQCNSTKE